MTVKTYYEVWGKEEEDNKQVLLNKFEVNENETEEQVKQFAEEVATMFKERGTKDVEVRRTTV